MDGNFEIKIEKMFDYTWDNLSTALTDVVSIYSTKRVTFLFEYLLTQLLNCLLEKGHPL